MKVYGIITNRCRFRPTGYIPGRINRSHIHAVIDSVCKTGQQGIINSFTSEADFIKFVRESGITHDNDYCFCIKILSRPSQAAERSPGDPEFIFDLLKSDFLNGVKWAKPLKSPGSAALPVLSLSKWVFLASVRWSFTTSLFYLTGY